LYPQLRRRFISAGGVIRTPISYPVYLLKYEEQRQRFAAATGIDGLYSIGRNGEFAHSLMEDVYWRTLRRMGDVADYVGKMPGELPFAAEIQRMMSPSEEEHFRAA
ncbi:MAG: hypothetical protein ACT60Q_17580, partial [Ferrovibrionaceae bacterium]